ncbi:MAG: hypothetical protein ACRD2X_11495 [Vicinamibacteraceae bacterium]
MPNRENIDRDWGLVLKHRDRVLDWLARTTAPYKSLFRFDRSALIDCYTPGTDFRILALHFNVSPGAVFYALDRLVKIAGDVDRWSTLEACAEGEPSVVIVPVRDEAEGEYVRHLLREHRFRARIEVLDENEEDYDDKDEDEECHDADDADEH